MTKVWLRLELFELGLLQLPLKYASTLTLENVKKALNLLHGRIQAAQDGDQDASMSPTASSFVDNDNFARIRYETECFGEYKAVA